MQEQIYWSIKEEPFKIPDETYDDLMYTFFSPEREGWLMKQVHCFRKFYTFFSHKKVFVKISCYYQPGRKLEELEETVVCFERSLPLLLSGFIVHGFVFAFTCTLIQLLEYPIPPLRALHLLHVMSVTWRYLGNRGWYYRSAYVNDLEKNMNIFYLHFF